MMHIKPKMKCRSLFTKQLKLKFICAIIVFLLIHLLIKLSKTETLDERENRIIKERVQTLKKQLSLVNSESIPVYNYLSDNKEQYETRIRRQEAKIVAGLGEGALPVTLEGEEKALADKLMKKLAFNIVLSDKIPYNRSLPDARNTKCSQVKYPQHLPSASVIIIFINEAWSSLIRTIHSVINRTPKHLLREIILVDDFSDEEYLQGQLDYYIKTRLPPRLIKLIRLPKRSGLIRARLAGASKASGNVLVFLDAHCEVITQWLEPLVARIAQNKTSVVVPIIDVIDDKTFAYHYNRDFFEVGGFTWNGHFDWIHVPDRLLSSIEPVRSPTMAGGLLAIDRFFFWKIGSYDSEMDIWGGENLEMSFRVWMCGGSIETIPCSRVGHIFRDFHPYTFPGNKDTHGLNTARAARVWMDDYSRLFFLHRPELKGENIGDIRPRLELRNRLKCHPFKWYLENIYPEKYIPDENVIAYGRVMGINNLCLDSLLRASSATYTLGVYQCNANLTSSQFYSLSHKGELRDEDHCASVYEDKVQLSPCNGLPAQTWTLTMAGQLRHIETGKCLDAVGLRSGNDIQIERCSTSPSQGWTFEYLL